MSDKKPQLVSFHGTDYEVRESKYTNGRKALVLWDRELDEMANAATVNLPDLPLGANQVFIKDYSENEGMMAALQRAGIVTATGESVRSGFVEVPIAELQAPFRERELEAGREDYQVQLEQVRPVTRDMIDSVMADKWPSPAALIDFGLDSQKHYEALYYPIRAGEIMPQALDDALGHGEKLTALARGAASNMHKYVD